MSSPGPGAAEEREADYTAHVDGSSGGHGCVHHPGCGDGFTGVQYVKTHQVMTFIAYQLYLNEGVMKNKIE